MYFISNVQETTQFKNKITIYPNSSNSEFNINFYSKNRNKLQIKVLNTFGQEIKNDIWNTNSGVSNRLIDLSNYPKGIYFLYIQSETESLSQKLILH